MPALEDRGSAAFLQMRDKHLTWRPVSETFARLIIDMVREMEEVALRNNCQICGARQVASKALVGVLDCPFLPRRTWVAKSPVCTDPFFQSPEPCKLGTTIKCEALTRECR
jgi:hypothetical protein